MNYGTVVSRVLTEFQQEVENSDEQTHHLLIDHEHAQYMLMQTGWQTVRRICTPQLYIRLENNKVWIEQDETGTALITRLEAAGIKRDDIILAFHHPHIRRLTDFTFD